MIEIYCKVNETPSHKTHGMPELKYSEKTFREMYEALREAEVFTKGGDRVHFKVSQALAKAEGK